MLGGGVGSVEDNFFLRCGELALFGDFGGVIFIKLFDLMVPELCNSLNPPPDLASCDFEVKDEDIENALGGKQSSYDR